MEATGAMDSLLKKLGDLLAEEYTRLKGVRRENRFLRSELSSMNAVLQKCAAMENPDIQVKAWTTELREPAYDIEDCVDEFVHGVGTKQRHGTRASCIKEFFRECARRLKAQVTRHKIADQVQELKERVVEVAEQRVRYKLHDVSSSSPSIRATDDLRLCALFPEESHLVGIDGPRDDLARWLLTEDKFGNRKVLSIYGFGGLGKTTLANEVRRNIGKQSDCEALVPVSQKPDDKKILWNILTRIEKKGTLVKERETWDKQMIIEKIRDLLKDKRWVTHDQIGFCSKRVEIVFRATYDTKNQLGAKAAAIQNCSVINHLAKLWEDMVRAMMAEVNWAAEGACGLLR